MNRRYIRDRFRNPFGIILTKVEPTGWRFACAFTNPTDRFNKIEGDSIAYRRYVQGTVIPFGLSIQEFDVAMQANHVPIYNEVVMDELYAIYVHAQAYRETRKSVLPKHYETLGTAVSTIN